MRAEVVAMTGENLDMDAIKKAGDILKAGTGSAGFHENIRSERKTVR